MRKGERMQIVKMIGVGGMVMAATMGAAVGTNTDAWGVPNDVEFKAACDNTAQRYVEMLPAGFDPAQAHDVLIVLHGHGSDRWQCVRDGRGEFKGARDVAAKRGTVFVSPEYRGNSWMGPAAEADMVQMIGLLRQKHKIGRVFLSGASMGGTSVLIFTALHPDLVAGVCSQNGIADMTTYRQAFAGIFDAIQTSYGGGPEKAAEEYRKRSPLRFPERFTMPVAIAVGEKDEIVPPPSTLKFAEAIRKKGNRRVLVIARQEGGHETSYDDTVAALEFMMAQAATLRTVNLAPTAQAFVVLAGQEAGQALPPGADGSYTVAAAADGMARFGLQWTEGQQLTGVSLALAPGSPVQAEGIRLHVQGDDWKWQELPDKPACDGAACRWRLDARKAMAVKWVIPSKDPVVLRSVCADGPDVAWLTADLRLESTAKDRAKIGIETYNGLLVDARGNEAGRCSWDTAATLPLKVLYTAPKRTKESRTLLRFDHPAGGFSVAVEDVVAKGCVYVPHAGVFVTTGDKPVAAKNHLAAVGRHKSVLEQVRRMPDQTFAQAMSKTHDPRMDNGPMMLSLACDNRKFIVGEDGSIERPWSPDYGSLSVQVGAKPIAGRDLCLEGGWRPIPVIAVREQDGVVYRQRVCVAPLDDEAPANTASWARRQAVCAIEWRITNAGQAEAEARIVLSCSAPAGKTNTVQAVDGGATINRGDELIAFVDAANAEGVKIRVSDTGIVLSARLGAGQSTCWYAYLPGQETAAKDHAALRGGAKWFDRTVAYWDKVMAPAMQIDIPEEPLANIIRASQVHCMIAARDEEDGRRVAAWIAAKDYGAFDTESQPVIRGMDMMGHQEFARRALDYWLARYTPEGPLQKSYSIAGTGQNLWTVAEHYRRTGDRTWLEKEASKLAAACQWIGRERLKSMVNDNLGRPVPEWGLTPPGTSADWGLFDKTPSAFYRFYNEGLFYIGLSEMAEALADIGRPEAADLLKDAEQYRNDLRRAYRWDQERSPVLPLPSGAWVRAYPAFLNYFGLPEEYFPDADWGRAWWCAVDLGPHHLAVNGVLDPQAADVTEMIDHLEDVQFLRTQVWAGAPQFHMPAFEFPGERAADVFNFGGWAKGQPYYGRTVELYGLRDDVKPFIRSYFNTIASLVNPYFLWIWECSYHGSWNKTHETGWFLCQTRILFVQERGDELWLAPFVTGNWLKDGLAVSVKQAPTRFGPVGYRIASSVAKGCIDATIEPPTRTPPKAIVIRLRHPEGKPIKRVTVNGEKHADFDAVKECVRLKPSKDKMHVRAYY